MTEPDSKILKRADLEELWRQVQAEGPSPEAAEFARAFEAARKTALQSIVSIKDVLSAMQAKK